MLKCISSNKMAFIGDYIFPMRDKSAIFVPNVHANWAIICFKKKNNIKWLNLNDFAGIEMK